jgi:HAMP domain-containing protein
MNENRHSNQNITEEENKKRVGLWASGIISVIGLSFVVFSLYIGFIVQEGVLDLSDRVLIPVSGLGFLASIISFFLIRNNRLIPGNWLMFSTVLFPPIVAALLLQNFGVIAIIYMVVVSPILIGLVMPIQLRRFAVISTVTAVLVTIIIELVDPAFRISSTLAPNFASSMIVLALFGMLALLVQSNIMPIGDPSTDSETRIRRALRTTGLLVAVAFVLLLNGLNRGRVTGAWQFYANASVSLIILVVAFFSIRFFRTGRLETGGWMVVSGVLGYTILSAFFTESPIGIYMGAFVVFLSFVFISQTFYMQATAKRAQFFTIIGGVLITLLYQVEFSFRSPNPGSAPIGIIAGAIAGVVIIIYAVRRAWTGNIQAKFVTVFIILALVSVSIVGSVSYFNFRSQVRHDIRQRLVNMVSIAALQQDGDLHAVIQNPGDEETEVYKQLQAINLAIVATEPEVVYLYTMRMNDQGEVQFFVDAGQSGDDDLAAVAEFYETPTPLMLAEFPTLDQAIAEEEFFTDKWGTWLTAYAPFYNSHGEREGIIGIDIAAVTVLEQENAVLTLIAWTILGSLLIVAVVGFYLGNLFTRPIVNLAEVAQQVADGNLRARAEVETTDEIGTLATTFNAMTTQLRRNLEGLEQRVADRTRALETSTEVSRRLSTILDQRELVREVVEQVQTAFDYYHAHIYLVSDEGNYLEMVGGTGDAGQTMLDQDHQVAMGLGLVGQAAELNQIILVSDTSQAEGWLPNSLLPETKAEVAVPIAIGENVLGVLDVQDNQVGGLTQDDANLLASISNQIAIALQNTRVYREAQRQADREALIGNIGQQIQSTASIEDALQVAVRELGQALGTDTSVKLRADEPKNE